MRELIVVCGRGHEQLEREASPEVWRPSYGGKARVLAAIEYLRDSPEDKLIAFCEGSNSDEPSGAEIMYNYFRSNYKEEIAILLEEESKTTIEHFTNLKNKLNENVEEITIISDWYHKKRCKILGEEVFKKNVHFQSAQKTLKYRYGTHPLLSNKALRHFSLWENLKYIGGWGEETKENMVSNVITEIKGVGALIVDKNFGASFYPRG